MSNRDPKGYYAILGVSPNADAAEIKAAYRRRAKELHPDRNRAPDAAAQFCGWALASKEKDSVQRVADWCTKGKSDMPPRESALAAGGDAFKTGMIGKFASDVYPGARAEPRVPPEVYKIISDAIQQTQLGGADPQATATSASQQLDSFLGSYSGAPIL